MKTENLVLLAIAGIAIYYFFFKNNGTTDGGGGGGGGGGSAPIIDPTQPNKPYVPSNGGKVPIIRTDPNTYIVPIINTIPNTTGGRNFPTVIIPYTAPQKLTETTVTAPLKITNVLGFPVVPHLVQAKAPIIIKPSVANALSKTNVGKQLLARLKK